MLRALGVIVIALILVVAGLVYWLTRSRERSIQAENAAQALLAGRVRQSEGNKIMAEPIASESAWLRTHHADEQLHDSSDQSGAVPLPDAD